MNNVIEPDIIPSLLHEHLTPRVQARMRRIEKKHVHNEEMPGKLLVFGVLNKLCLVNNYEQALNKVTKEYALAKGPVVVSYVNAHAFNLCFEQPEFRNAILQSDLVFRDGKGMEILCRSMGVPEGINMCGTDSIPMILERFKGSRVAVLGSTDPYLTNAVGVLIAKGHQVVLRKNGFCDMQKYIGWLKAKRPQVILLGMGMPKQELLSKMLKEQLGYKCLIINGGAIIDQFGKKLSRAPLWMRKRGLEWLYRLVQEPRRLFNRYVVGNIAFLQRVRMTTGRIKF